MNGELLPVWSRTWQEIWMSLAKSSNAPGDLFIELVRALAPAPREPAPPPPAPAEAFDVDGKLIGAAAIQARDEYEKVRGRYLDCRDKYETAINSEGEAQSFFRSLLKEIASEGAAIKLLEAVYSALIANEEVGLAEKYQATVRGFLKRYSLRYEIKSEFSLYTTLPGVFSKMISEMKRISESDHHIRDLFSEFEEAFADLKTSRTQARMKTCLQKQFNLLEALGRGCPNVTEDTLGAMCNQLDLPHPTIKEVGKKLYGFGSNYPGVRHAGNADGVIRQLNMTDFVSLSLMLASFTPYVAHSLDSDRCYTG